MGVFFIKNGVGCRVHTHMHVCIVCTYMFSLSLTLFIYLSLYISPYICEYACVCMKQGGLGGEGEFFQLNGCEERKDGELD